MKRVTVLGATLALLLVPVLVRLLKAQSPPPSQTPPPPTYTFTDLGRMDLSAAPSGPTALSSNGQVAGLYFNYTTQVNRAFFWSNGTLTELGTLGGPLSFGYGINTAGQIVGTASLSSSDTRAFIWPNPNNQMTNLGDINPTSGIDSQAFGVNSNGDVVGYENRGGGVTPIIWKGGTHAGATVLSSLPCQFTLCSAQVLALNDAGQAAGFGIGPFVKGPAGSYNANQAVMWDANGQATGLGSLGSYLNDRANAINSKGDVVGYSQIDSSMIHAVLWQNGNPQSAQDLGAIPGIDPLFGVSAKITDNSSSAWGVNSKGDIVGISAYGTQAVTQGNGGRAFLYTNGTMYDLLSLVPGTNWKLLHAAWAINDAGQIVGVGIDPTTNTDHGFLLTPIITPTTTSVSASVNPSVFGQSVSFTATVTPAPPYANAVSDTVTFSDGGTTLGSGTYNGNGTWILSSATLLAGTHSITASYGGDNNYGSSTSAALTQTVTQAATTTTLAAFPNPATYGKSVTLSATVRVVAPGSGTSIGPTGTVTFYDNNTPLICAGGDQTFTSGQPSCVYGFTTPGSHSLTASYSGDANFTASTTASGLTLTVNPQPPVITAPSSGTTTNGAITVSGTASANASISIFNGLKVIATATADAAGNFSAGVTLGVGSYSLTATETLNGATSIASTALSITVAPTPPTIASPASGYSSTNPIVAVGGTGLSGATVTILDGTTTVGTGAADTSGNFTVSVTLAIGVHSLTATQTLNGITSAASAAVIVTIQLAPVVIADNETITVTDATSFPDVFDSENVKVTDKVMVYAFFPISISPPAPILSAVQNQPYSGVTFSGTGGRQGVTLSESGTVPGMSFAISGASASFSGTPTQAGIFPFNITATDSTGNVLIQKYSLVVAAACPTISVSPSGSLGTVTVGSPFAQGFTAKGGVGTTAWSESGALPKGIGFSTGVLSGTPTQPGTVTVTVVAADQNGCQGTSNVSLVVVPPPAVIMDSEIIHVTDTPSFPDVFDSEQIIITDQVSIQVLNTTTTSISIIGGTVYGAPTSVTVSVSSSTATVTGNVTLSLDGGTASTMALTSGSATFNLGILRVGPHALTANFPAQGNFLGSSAATKFAVTQATPLISWKNPAPVTYGTPLGSAQLNAIAPVQGSFAYSPAAGTVLTAGSQTLSVTFTPTDSTDYTNATASVTLVVNNTPTGLNVPVLPVDSGTGASPVSLTFSNVTQAGVTSLAIGKSGPATPAGFAVGTPPIYFNLSTTAGYKPPITVCINYAGISFPKNTPALFHYENGAWVNVTTSVDTTHMVVCGNVTSLSPFALFAPLPVVTVTAPSVPRQYGLANPLLNNVTYSGFVNGDTPSVLSGTLSCLSPASPASPVGTYAITCSGLTSPNYTIKFAPGVLTITPAPLTDTAANGQRVYGAANPVLAGTIAGIQNGDNITAKYSTAATPTSPVGVYAIVPTLLDPTGKLGNYTVTSSNGTLTVIQASTTTALNVAPNPSNFGQSVTLTATVAPAAPGAGTVTGKVIFFDGNTTLGTTTLSSTDTATFTTSSLAAGSHSLTASYSGDPNFTGSSSSGVSDQVQCGVLISLSPSTVALGGTVTVTGKVISCTTTTQMVVVKFSLSGPSQPNSCSSTKSEMFTTPPFPLPPKTAQTVSFPFKVPSKGVCPGTYSITATTLVNGVAVDNSTASLTITAH